MILTAPIAAAPPAAARAGGPLFRFFFCNDLHIATESHARSFGTVIDAWLSDTACFDFVIIAGDLVNNGTLQQLSLVKKQLDRIPRPYYVIPGNHDLTDTTAEGRSAWRAVFGPRKENYIVHFRGYALVFLDVMNGACASLRVAESANRWARQNLSRLKRDIPLIVITHASLHPDIPRFPMSGTETLFDILDTLNVRAFFSGHYHALWHSMRNGAHYYNNVCLSAAEDNHDNTALEGLLWVSAYADSVQVEFVEAGGLPRATQPCKKP